MSQNLQFLRTSTPNQKPTSLLQGQIAFNIVDKVMFVGDGSSLITNVNGVTSAGVAGKGFFETDLDISTAVAAAKSYTDAQISALIDGAPGVLNTLNELAAALGDDANFVTTITSNLATGASNLAAEVTRAQAAEATLAANLNTEELRALSAEGEIAQNLADETTRALAAESVLTSNLTNEIARAIAAEGVLTSGLSDEVARAVAAEGVLTSDLSDEVARATAAEAALVSDLAAEAARAAAAEADLVADLAAETARATAAEADLASDLAAETARATAAEADLASDLAAEVARAGAAESALDARVDNIEENLNTKIVTIFDNSTATFPDAAPPVADPGYRDGWYFTNDTAGKKINWYFFDGNANTSTLGTFNCYAVVTLDSVAKLPFFGIYTKPGASGNGGSWYRSRRVMYPDAPTTYVAGQTYLMYFGVDPQVHPELPRITLKDEFNSVGPRLASEEILTVGLNSDSSAGVNLTKFLVDSVGVKTAEGVDVKSLLRFRKPTLAQWIAGFDLGTF